MQHRLMTAVTMICALAVCAFPGCRAESSDFGEAESTRFKAGKYWASPFRLPLAYRLFQPDGHDQTRRYPLFLFLSSSMGRGFDNKAQIERGARVLASDAVQGIQPCFVLAPQCPPRTQWLNTSFKTMPFPNYDQDGIPESDTMKSVVKLINKLVKEFNIDPDRIYVTGDSMGSSGTWDIITRHPDLFAAAFTSSGVSDPSKAPLIAHMPIWAFHGEKDRVSDVNNTRNMVRELRRYGSDCRFTEFEGAGHGIPQVYEQPGLFPWAFSQARN